MRGEDAKGKAAPLEWLAAALSLAIFIGLFATIFWQGIERQRTAVPEPVIEGQRIVTSANGSLVEFTVHNRSDQTAAAVVVEGTVTGAAGQPSSVTIDYVPARSKVRAGLMFPGDVRGKRVEIRPVGYRQP